MFDINKQQNETELQYIWRLGSAKDSGLLDMTWSELADVFNKNLRQDEEWTESTYRKKYSAAKQFYSEVFLRMGTDSDHDEKMRELAQAKVQYQDERRAWQKQNTFEARVKNRLDIIEEEILQIGQSKYTPERISITDYNETDLIVCLSDMHIGAKFNNIFGEYNTDIAYSRLDAYAAKVLEIGQRHGSKNIYVSLLGDEINGNIHFTTQVANGENIIEQVKIASEIIANFCFVLSKYFENVFIIGVAGNHSRLVSNKDMAIHDERLDNLITWIVDKMTSHVPNIHLLNRNIDSGIFDLSVRGKTYIGIHGDMDSLNSNSIRKLISMIGFFPYAIIAGHNHYPASTEVDGVKVIQSGCLCGSGDDYTKEKRLSGKANQTVIVCNECGIDAVYNVELS
mgnify:CR=1 FL=1